MAQSLDIAHKPSSAAPDAGAASARVNLLGLSREQLAEKLAEMGVAQREIKMRVTQLWNGIYTRGLTDFAAMTTLSKDTRTKFGQHFSLARPEIVTEQKSVDGTRKWLLLIASSPIL